MEKQPAAVSSAAKGSGGADWQARLEDWRERIASRMSKQISHGTSVNTASDEIPIVELCRRIKPVVVAYNGYAIGVGLVITLGADYRICAASAKVSPRFAALGLTPEYGSSHLLPQICGLQNALDLMLGAKILTAEGAQRMGLVGEVAPDENLLDRAIAKASEDAANAPSVTRVTKQVVRANIDAASIEKVLQREVRATVTARSRPPYAEAVRAFTEKREPVFYKE